jgi:hypothetical protein
MRTVLIRLGIVALWLAAVAAMASLSQQYSAEVAADTAFQSSPGATNLINTSPPPAASLESTALDSQNIQLLGHVGGQIRAVALQGQYAYVGIGPRLVILDVTTPATMTQVGQTSVLPDIVLGVAVSGTLAYVADGAGGLRIINVSNPAAPVEVGFYVTRRPAQGVAVSDGYAYTIWGSCENRYGMCFGEMQVLDISNPATISQVGTFELNATFKDIVVARGYAYLAGNQGLWVVNVAAPTAPAQVGFYAAPSATDVSLVNNYAYVATASGLRIINVSNQANPVQVGAFLTEGPALGVDVAGHYAYVLHQGMWNGNQYVGGRLRIVNVSNPSAPVAAGSYDLPEYAFDARDDIKGVLAAGSIVYHVAADNMSLDALNVLQPATPVEIGSYQVREAGHAVVIQGNYAYIAADTRGLQVVDVSIPAAPRWIGSIDTPGNAKDVAVVGNTAYVADESGGLRVINVSNPVSLTETGFYTSTWSAQELVVKGNYAYVAAGSDGLRVLDIADPVHPTEVGFSTSIRGYDVAASESYVFVYGDGELYIMDVSRPATPVVTGSLAIGYGVSDLATADSYVYLLESFYTTITGEKMSWFAIVDVSNPISPTIAYYHYYIGGGLAGGIVAATGMVYIADENQVCLFNVTTPAAPAAVGCRSTPGPGLGVQVVSQNIYAVGQGGLYILREGFSIAGQVLQANGLPFTSAGVTIVASGGATTTTNATGAYTLENLMHGSYVVSATVPSWTVWPVTQTATIPPNATGQNFTVLPQPVSVTLTTLGTVSLPARLAYTDTQGLVTQLDFPTGALSHTTTLILTPTVEASTPGFAFAGHAFELTASQNGQPLPGLTFNVPVTATLRYSDDDVRVITDENQLALWWRTRTGWMDAAQTCQPASAYSRNVAGNSLSLPICHLSRFGLFGPTHQLYLPNVMRNSP